MESRLTELEIKLSYTEDLVEDLNRIVYAQQARIDALQKALLALRQQVESITASGEGQTVDERPPHY